MKQSEYIAFLIAVVLSFFLHLAMEATLVEAAYISTRPAPGHEFKSFRLKLDSDIDSGLYNTNRDANAGDVTPENEQAKLAVLDSLEARYTLPFSKQRGRDVDVNHPSTGEAGSECEGGAEELLEQRGADNMYDYVLESEYGLESDYYDLEDGLQSEGGEEEGEEWDCEEDDAPLVGDSDWKRTPF